MELLLMVILFTVFILNLMLPKSEQSGTPEHAKKYIAKEKQCPPHKWLWKDILDEDGEKQGERIICEICGPLSRSLNGEIE